MISRGTATPNRTSGGNRIAPDMVGILIEGERTNYFCRSGHPMCQRVALTPGRYVLSTTGPGSVTIDALPGIESRNRRSWARRLLSWPWRPWSAYDPLRAVEGRALLFEITSPTAVSIHVDGGPVRVQLEDGLFASSYIETLDVPVTRAADSVSYTVSPTRED